MAPGGKAHLVLWVVDEGRGPLALVVGVGLYGALPLAAAGCGLALGVGNLGRLPIAIFLLIPVLWLRCLCIIPNSFSAMHNSALTARLGCWCGHGTCSTTSWHARQSMAGNTKGSTLYAMDWVHTVEEQQETFEHAWVINLCWLIIQPALWFLSLLVLNHARSVLIPILRLGCLWVCNPVTKLPM